MKKPTKKQYLAAVAALGCIACAQSGYPGTPAELHHIRETVGMGQRAGDDEVIPLCPAHHRGTQHPRIPSIHLSRRAFVDLFGTESALLDQVRRKLA